MPPVVALMCGLAGARAVADDVPRRTSASVSVTAIDFDVTATKGGQPVLDLKAEDVVLKVDGRRVELSCPRLADARVAVALRASAWSHPRAVVLLVSGDADVSHLSAEHAKTYLQDLGVPLVVWTVGSAAPETARARGGGRRVRRRAEITAAVRDLEAHVARQRIVWVEGEHLLRMIAVAADAPAGVEVVR